VRKAVAANMARSRSEIPEATVWVDVDATALVELRKELKASDQLTTRPACSLSSPALSPPA
jgi:pyruvate/2-oxoglutarate dehydrogenase complex dihydrolipoamide acyltransferase (E2) component